MENYSFEQKVRSIDWVKYLAPEYFDPNKMNFDPNRLIEVLIELNDVDELNISDGFLSDVRYALGNDHRGTYYPAALEAIDLIIEIERNSNNQKSRNYARYVLNDLHYFQLEMGGHDGTGRNRDLYDAVSNSIKEKLKPYSDEELENS